MGSDRVRAKPPGSVPAHGVIVLLCKAGRCADGTIAEDLLAELGAYVSGTAHSVLISAPGCIRRPADCQFRHPGTTLVVQPTDARQRPVGPAVPVGPVHTAADVRAVREWFDTGGGDPSLLPAHLRALQRPAAFANHN